MSNYNTSTHTDTAVNTLLLSFSFKPIFVDFDSVLFMLALLPIHQHGESVINFVRVCVWFVLCTLVQTTRQSAFLVQTTRQF